MASVEELKDGTGPCLPVLWALRLRWSAAALVLSAGRTSLCCAVTTALKEGMEESGTLQEIRAKLRAEVFHRVKAPEVRSSAVVLRAAWEFLQTSLELDCSTTTSKREIQARHNMCLRVLLLS